MTRQGHVTVLAQLEVESIPGHLGPILCITEDSIGTIFLRLKALLGCFSSKPVLGATHKNLSLITLVPFHVTQRKFSLLSYLTLDLTMGSLALSLWPLCLPYQDKGSARSLVSHSVTMWPQGL